MHDRGCEKLSSKWFHARMRAVFVAPEEGRTAFKLATISVLPPRLAWLPPRSSTDSRDQAQRNLSMATSPSSSLLSLPPVRPSLSPTKSTSFARTPSSIGTASASSMSASRSATTATKRARSSSIVSVTEVKETYDDQLDQAALHNVNAEWVNYKGTRIRHERSIDQTLRSAQC